LVEEFDILQIVGEGWFGKILLVEHRASDTEIVLKALPKPYVSIRDFYREFHYSLHLSAHRNIVTTFDVAFETAGFYVFCQEYAPLGKYKLYIIRYNRIPIVYLLFLVFILFLYFLLCTYTYE
jgi:serine/threonine-protein kinase SBK